LLAPLRRDFPAPVMVVQHIDPRSPSLLPELLAPHTALVVKQAEDGERLSAATVYVAPPGRHLLVNAERRCALSDAPPVWFARPAADPLFVSVAEVFGARALAVVLTGKLRDGADGAIAIRNAGGVVLAQDPASCRAPGMPRAAIECGAAQLSLPLAALGPALSALVRVRGAAALFGLQSRAA
jgi:two-component system chemotaxis response regulator CheB